MGTQRRYTVGVQPRALQRLPSMEVMIPIHGFSSARFGRRMRSLGSGGRRVGAMTVEAPLRGMLAGLAMQCYVLSKKHLCDRDNGLIELSRIAHVLSFEIEVEIWGLNRTETLSLAKEVSLMLGVRTENGPSGSQTFELHVSSFIDQFSPTSG